MSVDILKPNKNTGLAVSEPGPVRILPGGYSTKTSGASFELQDSEGNIFTVPAGDSSFFLPNGATQLTSVKSPAPSVWSKLSGIPSTFGRPRGACKISNGSFVAIDNTSNIIKSTDGKTWTSVRSGTTPVELVHNEILRARSNETVQLSYPGAQLNDVSIVFIVDADGSPTAPSGYTNMNITTLGVSGTGANYFYRVLSGGDANLSYSKGTTQLRLFHFVIRGISGGSNPTWSTQSRISVQTGEPRPIPASLFPVNSGAFGLAVNQVYTTQDLNLAVNYGTDAGQIQNADGFLTYELEGMATSTSVNEWGYYGIGTKILDNNETFVAPNNERLVANNNGSWSSTVIIFEPVAAVISAGFSASDIAASPDRVVAVDSVFGKTLHSVDGTTWVSGDVSAPSPTPPTVLWRHTPSASNTSNNVWTLPSSPALQKGDLIIAVLGQRVKNNPAMLSPGWKLIDGTVSSNFTWSESAFYKVVGDTPDTSFQTQNQSNATAHVMVVAIRGASADIRSRYVEGGSGVPNPGPLTMSAGSVSVITGMLYNGSYASNAPAGYEITQSNVGEKIIIGTKAITTSGTEDPGAFLDPNGTASNYWVARTFEVKPKDADGIINSLVWDGTRFVGGGNGFFESADGISWTKISNPLFSKRISKIVYSGSQYIAGTTDGDVLKSADALTWSISRPSSYKIVGLAGGSEILATDESGSSYKTDDFINWSEVVPTSLSVKWYMEDNSNTLTKINFMANPGDLVIATYSSGSTTGTARTIASTGWTTLANTTNTNTAYNTLGIFYKIMGETPDTSFEITQAFGNPSAAMSAVVIPKNTFALEKGLVLSEETIAASMGFGPITIPNDNTLLVYFMAAQSTSIADAAPFGVHPTFNVAREICGSLEIVQSKSRGSTSYLSLNRFGLAFSIVPKATTRAGLNTPYWGGGTSNSTTRTLAIPLKDTRTTATVGLEPFALTVNRDGLVTAASASGVESGGTLGATGLGDGVAFLNGRQVNVITSARTQFVAGSQLESAVISSLG